MDNMLISGIQADRGIGNADAGVNLDYVINSINEMQGRQHDRLASNDIEETKTPSRRLPRQAAQESPNG